MSRLRLGRRRRQLAGGAVLATVLAVTLIGPALTTTATGQPDRTSADPSSDGQVQVVMVDAPTVAKRNQVIELGLDITEHATQRGIEVVLYDDADRRTLREAGFTWKVEVADLEAQTRADRRADRQYAASVARSPLPSGRTSYRTYEEYVSDMQLLAQRYPKQTRPLTLPNETVLGEPIHGLEISAKADNIRDGKPVFLLMGAHHAREWPSAEHTMEFAFDLLQTNAYGDPRSVTIMNTSRLVIVPVVNVDGFQISRNAEPLGDFSSPRLRDEAQELHHLGEHADRADDYTAGPATTTSPAGCAAPTSTATTPATGAAAALARTGRTTPTAATGRAASPSRTQCGSSSPTEP